ncbi:hypothetical protein CRUP_034402 [Coryphaenoides rupestris]|nr:hypothetical protein CRUP_034402 [Coryphaenoides rupestris]
MSDALLSWCVDQLHHKFGLEVCDDIVRPKKAASPLPPKKKNKFVNLYAKEGEGGAGRHAPRAPRLRKHNLINNCISCGRIVCEQEGSGPCLFCGNLSSDRDYLPHQEARMNAGLEKALQHKDKLLEYDKNSVRRTQVLDDESDYFATDSNQWLSPGERDKLKKREEELRELRHASRKDRKITLDFAGRQVLDDGDNFGEYYNKLDETISAISTDSFLKSPPRSADQEGKQNLGELVNPNIVQAAPQWVEVEGSSRRQPAQGRASLEDKAAPERSRLRLQDRELQEISDGGWCLSMHQPWASLLVLGIKRMEGRTWYTSHRGRLWIAAAAKKPTPQETAEVESMYRQLYKREPRFPKDYPTGCLLGCVNVADCLTQDQLREQFSDTCEESSSPFVFICTNPQELVVKFPMKGKHKICKHG